MVAVHAGAFGVWQVLMNASETGARVILLIVLRNYITVPVYR